MGNFDKKFGYQPEGEWVDTGLIDENGNRIYEQRPVYPTINFSSNQDPERKCSGCGDNSGWIRESGSAFWEPRKPATFTRCLACNRDGSKSKPM